MKNKILLLLSALCFTYTLVAQKGDPMTRYMHINSIDTAYLKASYRYSFHQNKQQTSSQMSLLVGDKTQLFLGEDDYYADSLGLALENKSYRSGWIQNKMNELPKGRSNIKWRVYTGYPEGGITITDRIFTTDYISEESLTIHITRLN